MVYFEHFLPFSPPSVSVLPFRWAVGSARIVASGPQFWLAARLKTCPGGGHHAHSCRSAAARDVITNHAKLSDRRFPSSRQRGAIGSLRLSRSNYLLLFVLFPFFIQFFSPFTQFITICTSVSNYCLITCRIQSLSVCIPELFRLFSFNVKHTWNYTFIVT